MALAYPPFAYAEDEFVCLDKSLACVDWYVEWQELLSRLAELDAQIAHAVSDSGLPFSQLIDEIVTVIDSNNQQKNAEARQSELAFAFHEYTVLATRMQTGGLKLKKHDIIRDIAALYCVPDTIQLRADLTAAFADTADQNQLTERLTALTDSKKRGEKKIEKHRAKVLDTFVEIPEKFNGNNRPDDEKQLVQYCINIVSTFITLWRERCKMFDVPVSHKGIAIHTIPLPLGAVWSGAYDKLEFTKLPHRAVYAAQKSLDYTERTVDMFNETTAE